METRFQAASLVASPSYPNAVAWSDENLVAVASGHLITILNPALLFGPRGLITIPVSKPFPIGVIERRDLLSNCLLSTCLSRDLRPCVRSISWSPIGLAQNGGCLLSICTIEGRVKLYRMPYHEFSAEWVEVCDISELMYSYFASINFMESETRALALFKEQQNQLASQKDCIGTLPISNSRKEPKRRKQNTSVVIDKDLCPSSTSHKEKLIAASSEVALFSCSLLQEGSSVEVLKLEGQQRIWITGTLSRFDGTNALIVFPETDDNEKQSEWINLDLQFCEINSGRVHNGYMQNNSVPKIRPSMNAGYLPQQISSLVVHGVEKILKIGDVIEAWTNDRWIEGTCMGLNESGVVVKLHGDVQSITLDASSIRLVPVWIDQEKSWQITIVKIVMNDQELCREGRINYGNMKFSNLTQPHLPDPKVKTLKKTPEASNASLVTADQYASRSALLSSLIVAWSPIVQSMYGCCSILAVGGKSGKISFWRINGLQCFSAMSNNNSTSAFLVGILQAHSAWITSISWSLFASNASDARLLLATGSSDGSVKVWLGYGGELMKSSEVNLTPFSLLKEVIPTNSVPISVLAHIVSRQSPHRVHLAVGKGSGSFDVFLCDLVTSTGDFYRIGAFEAHDHVVTGLVWAFDGCCLYSCSQDNSVRSWILCNNSLTEVPIPSHSLGAKSADDVPNIFDSCCGLGVSPGNMAIAVVRSFDSYSLNPMYQARSQKAAVEFSWIGGQQIDVSSKKCLEFEVDAVSGFPENELVYWNNNLLWSLNQFGDMDKPLVVWDTIEALLAFKQSARKYVEHILAKWLFSLMRNELDLHIEHAMSQASKLFPKMSSRHLHLLNIMIRRVILVELDADEINFKPRHLKGLGAGEDEHLPLWLELLLSCENELRERLLAFTFSAVSSLLKQSSKEINSECWRPLGIAQMEQWVALNHDGVREHLKLLASDIKKFKQSKLQSICEYVPEEQCSYCSAPVPFESAEFGFCRGCYNNGGLVQSHQLSRCAASMQVCPLTPSWFCVCCRRRVSNLPPSALFRMPAYPLGSEFSCETSKHDLDPKPVCPFCGILLQRMQPEFLLSTSPV